MMIWTKKMREAASKAVGYELEHDQIKTAFENCKGVIDPEKRLDEVETYIRLGVTDNALLDECHDLRIYLAVCRCKEKPCLSRDT